MEKLYRAILDHESTEIEKAFDLLDNRTQRVLKLHFDRSSAAGIRSRRQIARVLGISSERVRQIIARAIVKLRIAAGLKNS